MARRPRIEVRRHRHRRLHARLLALRLDAGDGLQAQLLELVLREVGLAQHLRGQRQRLGQGFALAGEADLRALQAAADGRLGLERIETGHELLVALPRSAAQQHRPHPLRGGIAPGDGLFVAELETGIDGDGLPAGAARQQRHLQALAQGERLRARGDVLRRRLERLARLHRRPAGVAVDHAGDRRCGRNLGAVRRIGGHEPAQRAVARLQVGGGHPVDVGGRHPGDGVALHEQQAPVARCLVLRQRHRHRVDVVEQVFLVVGDALFRGLHLLPGHRPRHDGLGLAEQFGLGLAGVAILGQHGDHVEQSRIAHAPAAGPRARRQLGFHQRLVQAPARRMPEHIAQHRQRRAVGLRQRRHVVGGGHQRQVAAAAHRHLAFAVLGRLDGMECRQHARRLLQRPEMRGHARQRLVGVDAASHDQQRVVRLVPGAVERLQVADRHVLHVRPRTDGKVGIVVPVVGDRAHALHQHAGGIVVAGFHLVADDGHLAVQVSLGDPGIDHAVRFQRQQPVQRVVVGRERSKVVGAVQRGGGVLAHAALLHLAGDVRMRRRSLEQQVLQQVCHAGLAVVLLHRAHAVDQVDGNGGLARIGEQQHPQPVG